MNNTSDYLYHRNRIKEKYKKAKFSGWHDYEILEFVLFFTIPRKDTKPLAKELISKFGSLEGALNADENKLKAIKGISKHTAIFLNMLKEIAVHYMKKNMQNKDLISCPESVVNFLKTYFKGSHNEEFHALFLDSGNRLINVEMLQDGVVNQSVVFPRKVVESALNNHSTGVIIAHNHPGGTLSPSNEDLKATSMIKNALKTVDVVLYDHILIGNNEYYSWKENNLL